MCKGLIYAGIVQVKFLPLMVADFLDYKKLGKNSAFSSRWGSVKFSLTKGYRGRKDELNGAIALPSLLVELCIGGPITPVLC